MELNEGISSFFSQLPVLRLVKQADWRQRMRAAVARSGKKQSAIARDAGVAPETLSRILTSSSTHPSFDVVMRIARALNENVGWLLDERGFSLSGEEEKKLREVVRFLDDTLLAPAPRLDDRNAITATADIPRTYSVRGARLAYEATGDSMLGAGIIDGDVLYVRPVRSTREANGRIVVCRVDDVTYVKVLDVRARRIRLVSRNDRYAPIEIGDANRFELIGIVVGRTGTLG